MSLTKQLALWEARFHLPADLGLAEGPWQYQARLARQGLVDHYRCQAAQARWASRAALYQSRAVWALALFLWLAAHHR
jgi:hypothetical protein